MDKKMKYFERTKLVENYVMVTKLPTTYLIQMTENFMFLTIKLCYL